MKIEYDKQYIKDLLAPDLKGKKLSEKINETVFGLDDTRFDSTFNIQINATGCKEADECVTNLLITNVMGL